MMKTIHKFKIEASVLEVIDLPKSAEILTIQMQKGDPVIWAMLETSEKKVKRYFSIYTTGGSIDVGPNYKMKYINTFQLHHGDLVFHVFEILNK